MTPPQIPLSLWLETLRAASLEIAGSALRFDGSAAPRSGDDSADCPGAYIAMLGQETSMHLGLTSSPEGCRTIARGFLGVRRSTELSDREVMDGVSEVVNIIAGKVKSKMVPYDPSLRLGLPMYIVGRICVTERMERAAEAIHLGPVPCELHVYRDARAA